MFERERFVSISGPFGKCSATLASVAAPPPGARQGFGGPNYPRHPTGVSRMCWGGGGCSCDTPATHPKLQKELRRGCPCNATRGGGGVASATLRLNQWHGTALRLLNALNSEDRDLKVRFSLATIAFDRESAQMSQMLSSQGKNAPSNPYPHYLVRLATSWHRMTSAFSFAGTLTVANRMRDSRRVMLSGVVQRERSCFIAKSEASRGVCELIKLVRWTI